VIRVKATREGLLGHPTATGYVVDSIVPFVALPSHEALGKFIRIQNVNNHRKAYAVVLDIGPWNTEDNDYVFHGHRPQAESGTDSTGRKTNGAGIDLSQRVWHELYMTDNSLVEWEFI